MLKALMIPILLIIAAFAGYNVLKKDQVPTKPNEIIYKFQEKNNTSPMDTYWVSYNDPSVFKEEQTIKRRGGSTPELMKQFELRTPQDGAYYFIHNEKLQLVQEGKYTAQHTYEGKAYAGGFYNSKNYIYDTGGFLTAIHYQEDGRNIKTELYNDKKEIIEKIFYNKKSAEKEKAEIYNDGKLIETRIYTAFDAYKTIKEEP